MTIWPVYAYTLAAQNTVIKLLMLILYAEDNKILMHRYLHIFSLFGRNIISRGDGGLNFVKTKDRNFEVFFCMLTFSITNVCNLECLTDRDMQE